MFFDTLKNVLGIGGDKNINKLYSNALKGDLEYPPPSTTDKLKYSLGQNIENGMDKLHKGFDTGVNAVKRGLSNLNDGKNTLFQGIKGLPDKIDNGADRLRNGVSDILLGKQVEPETKMDENGNVVTGITNARQGGIPSFINDFKTGLNDNLNNAFIPSNMYPDNNKGFAHRLGEGIGTFGRILDNPLVRGLAVAGAVGAMGGSGGEALTYGVGTAAKNQQLRTTDKMYRDSMLQDEKNKLIENLLQNENFQNLTPEEQQDIINAKTQEILNKYNNINGYIGDDLYKNMLSAQQLKDNAEWRKANLLTQQQQMKALEEWRKSQLGLDWAKLQNEKEKEKKKEDSLNKTQKDVLSRLGQINDIRQLIKRNPTATGIVQGLLPGDIVNRWSLNPEQIETRTMIDDLRTEIRHILTGAAFSPKEAQEYEKFLPTNRDTPYIINAKLDGLERKLKRDFKINSDNYGENEKVKTINQDVYYF